MYLDNKGSISLADLIFWVKKELLSPRSLGRDPAPLFVIDEVTIEVNFVLKGSGKGGFDMVVVKAEGEVGEERIQKATVRLKPIIASEALSTRFAETYPQKMEEIVSRSIAVLFKGQSDEDDDVSVPLP